MSMVGIHYFLLSYSFCNPKALSEKLYVTPHNRLLKAKGAIDSLRDIIVARCGHTGPSSAGANSLVSVLSGDKVDTDENKSQRKKRRESKEQTLVFDVSIDEPAALEDVPSVDTPCSSKSKKR